MKVDDLYPIILLLLMIIAVKFTLIYRRYNIDRYSIDMLISEHRPLKKTNCICP